MEKVSKFLIFHDETDEMSDQSLSCLTPMNGNDIFLVPGSDERLELFELGDK
ncbi:MAG: hypothetical protein ABII02_00155 [Candidatus Magasanikbacteria bacterium]